MSKAATPSSHQTIQCEHTPRGLDAPSPPAATEFTGEFTGFVVSAELRAIVRRARPAEIKRIRGEAIVESNDKVAAAGGFFSRVDVAVGVVVTEI